MIRRTALASLMGLAGVLAVACATTAEEPQPAGGQEPEGVPQVQELAEGDGTHEVRYETFVDTSRHTGGEPNRNLPTDIYVPGGDGPFPLVVHAHGFDGSSAKFSTLLGAWADAGYVVVAPNFPLTNDGVAEDAKDLGDYLNQPADVAFVLDRVLEMAESGGDLDGLVSAGHIGLSGLSLGGATAYPSLFHPCCADDRYRSGIVMSALELPFEPGEYDYRGARPFPILAFAGTSDDAIPYELQQSIIAGLPGPTWSVTLVGGEHATPFENPDSAFDGLVAASTVDFWDLTLRGDESAQERLEADSAVEGLSTLEINP